MSADVRTVEKLVNGRNDTTDDSDMWLAPFKNTKSTSSDKDGKREPNFACVFFNAPTAISAIELWNYTKTPTRGVHEFEVEIDGSLLFRGYLKMAGHNTVIFSHHGRHIERLSQYINFNPGKRQNVLLMNERKVVGEA